MTKGRKPVPTVLKIIHGNPGHRPLPENEWKPPAITSVPRPPAHLGSEARKHWRRLVTQFVAAGLYADIDHGMLSMMCAAWGDHVEARRMITKHAKEGGGTGMFVKSPNGYPMQSPWLAVSNKSLELYSRIAVEFGMSPSSRARVQTGPVMPAAPETVTKQSGWKQFA